ncbi:cupin domain-containing carboxymuconolactone decarboxylase family protein [Chelonobacter oris]|uniref:cupin domain-containing carboxymuconolactone decarboxylase family protein n=1 Tax=Chelonobacter oris TaxID=505317 RepID=UPI0013781A6D|nr:carboxymuconolactone decarboxylase family protein [Chelonobacter oris]
MGLGLTLAGSAFAADFKGAAELQHLPQSALPYTDAPSAYFSGKARFARYPTVDQSADGWAIVEFDSGTINHWHRHSNGQYLIITAGEGLVQEWGKPIQAVKKGDAVWFPPDVKHWHGAAPNRSMAHITISPNAAGNQTTWLEAVDPATLTAFQAQANHSVQQTTPLTARQLAIVPIAALTAEGNTAKLKTALENGLAQGLSVNEIREIFTHLHAYAGFPRALNGLTTFNNLLKERADNGIQDPPGKPSQAATEADQSNNYHKGIQALTDMGSRAAGNSLLFDSEGIDYALKANLFGYLFSRDTLSYVDRELVVLATIASLGPGVEAQLASHFRNTQNLGVSQAQLERMLDTFAAQANPTAAQHAREVLNR